MGIWKKMKVDPYLPSYPRINSKWLGISHVKIETIQVLEENMDEFFKTLM